LKSKQTTKGNISFSPERERLQSFIQNHV